MSPDGIGHFTYPSQLHGAILGHINRRACVFVTTNVAAKCEGSEKKAWALPPGIAPLFDVPAQQLVGCSCTGRRKLLFTELLCGTQGTIQIREGMGR
jgi:hypothetical protein